jgi:hypothetical protein
VWHQRHDARSGRFTRGQPFEIADHTRVVHAARPFPPKD